MRGTALVLAGCGVEAGDLSTSTTTTAAPADDLSPSEQAAADRVARIYEDLGMDPEDADCLAKAIAGADGAIDPTDTSALMDIVNQCDIPISELNELGQDEGLDSMEDGIKFGLEATLKDAGLTEEQAACVADGFVEQFGTDVTSSQDPDTMRQFFEDCGVDPDTLGN